MKIAHKVYKFYSDAGHGWLCVSKKKLVKLGIDDKISGFSYVRNDNVFLEEDADAPLFLNEMKKRGFKYDIERLPTSKKSSKIRGYKSYNPIMPMVVNQEVEVDEDIPEEIPEEIPEKLICGDGFAMLVPYDC